MAKYLIIDGQSAGTVLTGLNNNTNELYAAGIDYGILAEDSLLFSGQKAFRIAPRLTDGNGEEDLELINLGNWGPSPQGTESRTQVPAGIMRCVGNAFLFRNIEWNNSLERFEQFNTAEDSYGAAVFEAGGEGCNMVHNAPGVHPFSHPVGLGFSVRGDGARGAETDGVVTGYVNQSFAKIFMGFETTVSGLKYWANDAADPMLWIQTKEAKGTENEMIALEANVSSASVYGGHYFRKSRGTMESKTAVVADDITGRIGWKAYDGNSYEVTAAIQCAAKGTISDGNVAQEMEFLISGTNTAGLAVKLRLTKDGVIPALPTSSAGLAAGTLWNDSGTVKVA